MKLIDNESLDRQIGVVAEVAGYLWERGWAERNGGNISVNVTGLCADAVCELPALDGPYPLPKTVHPTRSSPTSRCVRPPNCPRTSRCTTI